jgi:hypothetical protein
MGEGERERETHTHTHRERETEREREREMGGGKQDHISLKSIPTVSCTGGVSMAYPLKRANGPQTPGLMQIFHENETCHFCTPCYEHLLGGYRTTGHVWQ